MIVAIKLIGIFLGVLARSLAPYLRKVREGKIKSFQKRHLASSIGSLVLGIVITLLIFPPLFSHRLTQKGELGIRISEFGMKEGIG